MLNLTLIGACNPMLCPNWGFSSAHLRNLPGATGPFCAFDHPLDGKESFYFSGHYFGLVHPYFYRAMFPLKVTRWLHTEVLGRPFIVFDGCAQYLSAPWAPAMVQATPTSL